MPHSRAPALGFHIDKASNRAIVNEGGSTRIVISPYRGEMRPRVDALFDDTSAFTVNRGEKPVAEALLLALKHCLDNRRLDMNERMLEMSTGSKVIAEEGGLSRGGRYVLELVLPGSFPIVIVAATATPTAWRVQAFAREAFAFTGSASDAILRGLGELVLGGTLV